MKLQNPQEQVVGHVAHVVKKQKIVWQSAIINEALFTSLHGALRNQPHPARRWPYFTVCSLPKLMVAKVDA